MNIVNKNLRCAKCRNLINEIKVTMDTYVHMSLFQTRLQRVLI